MYFEYRSRQLMQQDRCVSLFAATIRCDAREIPAAAAQVRKPNVDTAGMDARLSSQEGN